ncbi:LysR substrate-binding domain-containing protein [Roseovarius atlanticus]|uniref:LysR substrate-binding domain-containing protein n=1 Tax=Roseovarius atlanticus TaxID=1641875 RepID=UPI001C98B86B|nr:LysR substrate-binding domain-containing protein [Roseovarius atlanticus]MBY5989314.1 LysR family transcriptional regulator [Roseovarius atlanticus]MBY6124706.1 LysR family transcriptional regulator [Roseovarius atlanticus]MBY6149201.1 LysR family transcriptional regulator [Roseovarius atlanticus]
MRLPPLNALRAFEAAARHGGFVGAAEELHVTRGAISRQIKLLEEDMGALLFRRHGKGVELTEAGRRLQPVLTRAFGDILAETSRIGTEASDLRIICPPATSVRWLLPRLERFRALHPGVGVRLTTDFVGPYGFDAHQYDVGFSVTHWPDRPADLKVQTLFPVEVTPACAPSLLETKGRPERPEDLARFLLLHETPRHADWRAWLEAFDVRGVDANQGSDFPNLDMAAKAATLGAGVVMADLALNRDELESGLLVKLFPEMVCTSPMGGICLIASRDRWDDPKVAAFREWAVAETR